MPLSSPKNRQSSNVPQLLPDSVFLEEIHEILQDGFDGTVEPAATVFLAGVLQQIAAEILENSVNVAKEAKPAGDPLIIDSKDIIQALRADPDLSQLWRIPGNDASKPEP